MTDGYFFGDTLPFAKATFVAVFLGEAKVWEVFASVLPNCFHSPLQTSASTLFPLRCESFL